MMTITPEAREVLDKSRAMVSYAANFEDVILARLFRGQESGFYVDVGAHDPLGNSNTRHFYERGWRGINIEPASTFHVFPIQRPRDINLQLAVSDHCGQATFVECSELPAVSQLSDDLRPPAAAGSLPCQAVTVATRTLASIFEQYAPPCIDFMSLDVEGHERQALSGNDWARFRPRVLVIEATLPFSNTLCHHDWEGIVLQAGYLFGYFDGINRFYVREDEKDMLQRLAAPVNVLDNFVSHRTAALERRTRNLMAQLERLRAAQRAALNEGALDGIGRRSLRLGLWLARRLTQLGGLWQRARGARS